MLWVAENHQKSCGWPGWSLHHDCPRMSAAAPLRSLLAHSITACMPITQRLRVCSSCVHLVLGHCATRPAPSGRVRTADACACCCSAALPRPPVYVPLRAPHARPLRHMTGAQHLCAPGLCVHAPPFTCCVRPTAALCAVPPKPPVLPSSAAMTGAVAVVYGG